MRIELSEEQRQAVDAQSAEPVRLIDPRTNAAYFLVRAEEYQRHKAMLDEEEQEAAERTAWLASATTARRKWVQENPYYSSGSEVPHEPRSSPGFAQLLQALFQAFQLTLSRRVLAADALAQASGLVHCIGGSPAGDGHFRQHPHAPGLR